MTFQLKHTFIGASIGLTFVSLWAGWHLYESMFGFALACLIAIIFEILRLSCLYSISSMKGTSRVVILVLYGILSFVCFSAGVLSFNSKIIKADDDRKFQVQKSMTNDVFIIKNEYSKRIDEQIRVVERHKSQMVQFLAQYPMSKIYPEKIRLDDEKINELNQKREAFFASGAEPTSEWISNQKAILGIQQVNDVFENINSPTARAATEFFGIGDTKLQKYAGVVLTFSIECGIILLVVLSMNGKPEEPVKKRRGRRRKEPIEEAQP